MWGRFNKHGAWKQFESDLCDLVAGHGSVALEVSCDYLASIDERIPKVFRIKATLLEGVGSPKMWIINHIPPRPRPEEPDARFRDLVREARARMGEVHPDGFFIEDFFERTQTGQMLRLPDRDPDQRPYAVLDFMPSRLVELFKHKEKILRLSRLSDEDLVRFYHVLLRHLNLFKEDLIAPEHWRSAHALCRNIGCRFTYIGSKLSRCTSSRAPRR